MRYTNRARRIAADKFCSLIEEGEIGRGDLARDMGVDHSELAEWAEEFFPGRAERARMANRRATWWLRR